jgi:hypothetical protein
MNRWFTRVTGVFALLALSLFIYRSWINYHSAEQLVKYDVADVKRAALVHSSQELASLTGPELIMSFPIINLRQMIEAAMSSVEGVISRDTRIEADEQLLRITSQLETSVDLESTPVRVTLTTEGSTNIEIALEKGVISVARIRLIPVLTAVRFEVLQNQEQRLLDNLHQRIPDALARVMVNLNNALASRPELAIRIPVAAGANLFPREFTGEAGEALAVKDKEAFIQFALNKVSHLITPDRIWIIGDLEAEIVDTAGGNVSLPRPEHPLRSEEISDYSRSRSEGISDYSSYKAAFDERKRRLLPNETTLDPGQSLAGVGRAFVLRTTASIIKAANVCVRPALSNQATTNQLVTIGGDHLSPIDCSPTRDCTPTKVCGETRDCSTASVDCGGFKWFQAGEKARCEVNKSVQRLDCERYKALEKASCEADKSAAKLACETGKAGDRAACETTKEALKRSNNLGRIAVRVETRPLETICVANMEIASQNLDLVADLDIDLSADLNVAIDFTPLDIVGHLACQTPWKNTYVVNASAPPQRQRIAISANLTAGVTSAPRLDLVLDYDPISVSLDPPPLETLRRINNFTVSCGPVNGLLGSTQFDASEVIRADIGRNLAVPKGRALIGVPLGTVAVEAGLFRAQTTPFLTSHLLGVTTTFSSLPSIFGR